MLMFRCTGAFEGPIEDIETNDKCNDEIRIPGPTCRQTPTATDGKASLLSYEYLSEVSSYNHRFRAGS